MNRDLEDSVIERLTKAAVLAKQLHGQVELDETDKAIVGLLLQPRYKSSGAIISRKLGLTLDQYNERIRTITSKMHYEEYMHGSTTLIDIERFSDELDKGRGLEDNLTSAALDDKLTLDGYQFAAQETNYHANGDGLILAAGLAAETGEAVSLIYKLYRKGRDNLTDEQYDELVNKLALELGDVLWFTQALADLYLFYLSEIAQLNLDKLAQRAAKGTINSVDRSKGDD